METLHLPEPRTQLIQRGQCLRFGCQLGLALAQRVLGPLACGDVGDEALEGDGLVCPIVDALALLPHPAFRAVLMPDAILELERPVFAGGALHCLPRPLDVIGMLELRPVYMAGGEIIWRVAGDLRNTG